MTRCVDPRAGTLAPVNGLTDITKLVTAYYTEIPDPAVSHQQVQFGTSGHRGSALQVTFNEWHILAITQAICWYRQQQNITGPLYLGFDTHALSYPAFCSALEVLAANQVDVVIAENDEYTPTPVISHAILTYNKTRQDNFADGIVVTPSHNPPHDGGFKYNPINGGPANTDITQWIEEQANKLLSSALQGVKRVGLAKALAATTTHRYDFLNPYVNDLGSVIDMDCIKRADLHVGIDPLGGAGVHYWQPIAERYQLNLTVADSTVDPTFRFIPRDWDGQIRMDPASAYAMTNVIPLKDQFDVLCGCDTDHDRHGIVSKALGLMTPNHYLAVAIAYLFQHRPEWPTTMGVGKTVVSTTMIDRVSAHLNRNLYQVPVGFKWFSDGLMNGKLGFCGEESAGATFSRFDGSVWTTDKDGIIPALLAAEITAKTGKDVGVLYQELENQFGKTYYELDDAKANRSQKNILKQMRANQITAKTLAGDPIQTILSTAPGNNASISGLKIITNNGWCVMRPSGTEDIYKIYGESFVSKNHLEHILQEGQAIVDKALAVNTKGEKNAK